MKRLTVSIPAQINLFVNVADDATQEQIKEAVVNECPKYPEIKAGTHFDPEEFEILNTDAAEEEL